MPVQMDDGTVQRVRGLPRRPQHDARPRQGRDPLPPGRHPGRGEGARDVDDVEVRADGPSLRRRQGRGRLRPEVALARGEGAAHPPLHDRDHQRDRAREGHSRAGRRHRRPGDGVDLRHVLDERRPLGARRRHREAARARRVGRPGRRDGPGRALLHPHRAPEAGQAARRTRVAIQGFGNVGSNLARLLAEEGRASSRSPTPRGGIHNPYGLDIPAAIATRRSTACSTASRAPTRSRTRS